MEIARKTFSEQRQLSNIQSKCNVFLESNSFPKWSEEQFNNLNGYYEPKQQTILLS